MNVPATQALAVEGGVIVHNCASRYALMMLRYARAKGPKVEDRYRRHRGSVGRTHMSA
jgi:hypothetical protein